MGRLSGFKYRKIVKTLKFFGFILDRQGAGSHEISYNHETECYTTIPNHAGDMPEGRLLTLYVFGRFSEKLFVLFFVAGKAAVPVAFPQKQSTHFLHEVLWAKGFRVNSLA